MAECAIENHKDFNEPMEVNYTDVNQIWPILASVEKLIQSNIGKISKLESEIESVGELQLNEQWVNDRGTLKDADSWLEWINFQTQKCALEAANLRFIENASNLILKAQNLARQNPEQFEKYKTIVMNQIDNMELLVAFGSNQLWKDIFVENAIEVLLTYLDFFDIDRNILDVYFSEENFPTFGLSILKAKIERMKFEDISK